MENFLKGMSTIGQLSPQPQPYPQQSSPWNDVAKSFQQAGNSIQKAIKDFSNEQQASKKT